MKINMLSEVLNFPDSKHRGAKSDNCHELSSVNNRRLWNCFTVVINNNVVTIVLLKNEVAMKSGMAKSELK